MRPASAVVRTVEAGPAFRDVGPPVQDDLPPDWRPALELLVRRHAPAVLAVLADDWRDRPRSS